MTPGLFITGTNTGVGKTAISAAILRLLAAEGVQAVGLKPIASGSERRGPGEPLRNADALELQAAAPLPLPYESVNPWCFEPAIAPHLAAETAVLPTPVLVPVMKRPGVMGRGGREEGVSRRCCGRRPTYHRRFAWPSADACRCWWRAT